MFVLSSGVLNRETVGNKHLLQIFGYGFYQ